jgi:competence protein ComEA
MGLRPGLFRRAFDSDSGEGAEPAGFESSKTYEPWSAGPERGDTHPGSDTDPASMPTTQEWRILDGDKPVPDSGTEEPPEAPARRRSGTEDRTEVVAADAVDAAEQRPSEEILALEKDLERAKVEAAAKLEELEGRLTGMEDRAASTERDMQKALARIADVERARAAEERAQRAEEGRPGEGAQGVEITAAAKRAPTPSPSESRIVPAQEGPVSLASATFDDLRALGLSVTQAKRVLSFRERLGGFDSVDDLDYVPGFPKSILSELKSQVIV